MLPAVSTRFPELSMTMLSRALAGVALGALGALAAAGAYTETRRAPDQP
jgi:enterochelin esterase-like enzyme